MKGRPLQIGVTGGIGSGKSLVCKIFSCLGVPTYDADSRAKSIMTTDRILIAQIKEEFGNLAYLANGELNRTHISKLIFEDEKRRERLNGLVHPRVAADTQNWIDEHSKSPYLVKEAALLIESGSYKTLDKIVLVTAPGELRIKRVLQRDAHRSVEEVKKIIHSQMPEEEKEKMADYIIYNDEKKLLIPQLLELHQKFLAIHQGNN